MDRLEPGQVLCGKWRIEDKIGEGGTATVWAATHRNGLRVAIKALRAELMADLRARARFLREGQVANRIGHPGVVKILDDDTTEGGVPFLVMELLEGLTLKDLWVRESRCLAPQLVIDIAKAVLDVLVTAHARGVVHRDLKPHNIFMLSTGEIKILDFGVAHLPEHVDQRTRAGAMLGTPAFMPPEQARGLWDQVDARSDLFALGATMWGLLGGGLVHPAYSVQELLFAAGTMVARPVKTVLPHLDGWLASIIDRALRFDRQDRWPTAAAMRAALDGLWNTDTLRSHPPLSLMTRTSLSLPLM